MPNSVALHIPAAPGSARTVRLQAVLLVVAAANAHLVYVAVESQPECVAHLKEAGTKAGAFRAAKPAC